MTLSPDRPCGSCTACCTVQGVRELKKPMHRPCQHLCAGGCIIYNARPKSCREYACLWKYGAVGDERDRPDLIGLVFEQGTKRGEIIAVAHEVAEGASYRGRGAGLVERLSKRMGVLVQSPDGRRRYVEKGRSRAVAPYSGVRP